MFDVDGNAGPPLVFWRAPLAPALPVIALLHAAAFAAAEAEWNENKRGHEEAHLRTRAEGAGPGTAAAVNRWDSVLRFWLTLGLFPLLLAALPSAGGAEEV